MNERDSLPRWREGIARRARNRATHSDDLGNTGLDHSADPADRAHVLKVAFLREARLFAEIDPRNHSEVSDAFDKAVEKLPAPNRIWFATLLVSLFVAFAAVTTVWLNRSKDRTWSPADTAEGEALGPRLTEYVSALYAMRKPRDETERATVTAPAPEVVVSKLDRGAPLRSELEKLLDEYRKVLLEPSAGDGGNEMEAQVARTNAALRAAGKPFLLDIIYDGAGPILTSYYAAKERVARAEGANIRVVMGQRLDTLNRSLAAVGYTSPHLGAALVTRDMLEREAVLLVAPALVPGGSARLVDDAAREENQGWIAPLEERAADLLRRDYAGFRSAALDRTLERLARRQTLLPSFRRITAGLYAVAAPTTLVSRGALDSLEGVVPRAEIAEWKEINEELSAGPARAAFDELVEHLSVRVERHEVQHQIDFLGAFLGLPGPLGAMLGLRDTLDIGPFSTAARCRDELSAELAAIASAGEHASAALVFSAAPLFDRNAWPTPHAVGAAIILDELSRELGIPSPEPLYVHGQVDRARAAERFATITERDPQAIATAAASSYTRLFGQPLPAIEWAAWQLAPAWAK